MGMLDGGGACLLNKALLSFFIAGEIAGQKFQGDLASEFCVFGEVNLSHSSLADLLDDLVMGNRGPDHKSSRRWVN